VTTHAPAAVVFDLGNVLIGWDPRPSVAAGVGEAEATRFVGAEDFDFHAWNHEQDLGRPWDTAVEELARSHPHWLEHGRAYHANFELSLTPLEVNVALLRDLHAAGVRLFALTNCSAELFPYARKRFDFLALFDGIVVSGEERLAKPDPAVFDVLAQRLGRPLQDCLFIDDSAANVAAAAEAGLDTIRYDESVDLRGELRKRGLPV
jgi:2-haloacid dehalogenase